MEIYRTEEEQIQALKQWWKENGLSIIFGILIGAGCIFAWRGWQTHLILQSQTASNIYQHMINASREDEQENIQKYGDLILKQYESTPYAQYAALLLARHAAESSDYATAGEKLRWVMDNTSQDQIKHIARLRLTRILLADNKLMEAQTLLDEEDQGEFSASYEEIRGDIHIQQGNRKAAREAYIRAIDSAYELLQTDPIIGIKLEDLGQG